MFTIVLTALLLHPVHETVSELEWNAETKRVEVALRLDTTDEQWLKQQVGGDDETGVWAVRYLRQKFRVTRSTKQQDRPRYRWIGRDDEGLTLLGKQPIEFDWREGMPIPAAGRCHC